MIRRATLLTLLLVALGAAPSAWAASTYATTVLANPSLVSFWRLNELGAQTDADGMTAADAAGAFPGTYHLGVSLGASGPLEGDPSVAAHFGTPDGYVEVPYTSTLNPAQFTVEAWVSPDVGVNNMAIVTTGGQSPDMDGYRIETFDDYGRHSLALQIGDGSGSQVLKGPDYVSGQWYYVAATYDGSAARWYVNGQLANSAAMGYAPDTSYPLRVGVSTVIPGSGQFQGRVADVALYKSALSSSAIAQHYQAGIDDGLAPRTTLEASPPSVTNQTSATFQFSSDSVDPTFECQLDGAAWQACASPYQLSGLGDGNHRLVVRAVNRAGRMDPSPPAATWRVDTAPPVTAFVAGPPAATDQTTATFSFTSAPGSTYSCRLDLRPPVTCSSPYTISGLDDGSHTLAVQATDPLGNVEQVPALYNWSIDTAPPSTFITEAPTAKAPTRPFVFTANKPNVTFYCKIDDRPWVRCTSPFEAVPLAAGAHAFRLRATDSLGNDSAGEQAYFWSVAGGGRLRLKLLFPKRVHAASARRRRRGRAAPLRLSWRSSAPARVAITVTSIGGAPLARVSLALRTTGGSMSLPARLRQLRPGRYVLVLSASAIGFSPTRLRISFVVAA